MANRNQNRDKDYEPYDKAMMVNPYTFVPVKKENNKNEIHRENAEEYYHDAKKLHTGVLHCKLQVRTPLAIPDPSEATGKDDEHKTYPFYKINNQYVIPGSSIRGVLRSVYETITDSCFSTLQDDVYLSKREMAKDAYKPGILKQENGNYILYSADRYLVPVSNEGYARLNKEDQFKIIEGRPRKIKINDNEEPNKTGDWLDFYFKESNYKKNNLNIWSGIVTKEKTNNKKRGILYIGEKIWRKHGESIFVQKDEIKSSSDNWQTALGNAYGRLLKTKKAYQNKSINKNYGNGHNGYSDFDNLSLSKGIPIWYKKTPDDEIYFSYASVGRTTYKNTLNNLVGPSLQRCTDRSHLCGACLLFGMIGGKEKDRFNEEKEGMGSRIRITDAFLCKESETAPKFIPLKELGSPRDSYLPFYAKYNNKKGQNDEAPISYDGEGVEIAGRKYYWHHKDVKQCDYEGDPHNKRAATMELIYPKAEFSFDIYYDGIRKDQLEKLLWTITLGDNDLDSVFCHKIGHGKPLGLGSIKIIVQENTERIIDTNGYSLKEGIVQIDNSDLKKEPGINMQAIEALLRVVDINQPLQGEDAGCTIDYPNILDKNGNPISSAYQAKNNKVARHQWYSRNKSEDKPQILPHVTDSKQGLRPYLYTKYSSNTAAKQGAQFEEGVKYIAKVTGYSDNKNKVFITVNGQKCNMWFKDIGAEYGEVDKIYKIGDELTVEYFKPDKESKYPKFKPCK